MSGSNEIKDYFFSLDQQKAFSLPFHFSTRSLSPSLPLFIEECLYASPSPLLSSSSLLSLHSHTIQRFARPFHPCSTRPTISHGSSNCYLHSRSKTLLIDPRSRGTQAILVSRKNGTHRQRTKVVSPGAENLRV